ncbi:MAG: hypothetical protein IJX56_03270, partial [Alistipes sp.]|nr:hypothetical protein [Alistipes sp.]
MKKMLKYIAAAMLSVSLFTGCIKEVVPTSGLLDTQVTLESQVAGIPVQMIYPGFAGVGYHCDFGYPSIMMVLEMYGEEFYCVGNYNYDHFFYYYFNMMQGPMYSWCTIFWNCYWPWVKSCNDVIRRVQEEGGNPVYEGIARLYRAFYYLDLVRLYEFKPYVGAEFDSE